MHGRGRKRISEYQTRLVEKQKMRAMYAVGERQMRTYYEKAHRSMGVTGEEMLRQLESRIDAVILRLGFALTIHQARQLVSHGHVLIDGRRIDVPSAQVKPGQEISLSEKARNFILVREAIQITPEPPGVPLSQQGRDQGFLHEEPRTRRDPPPGDARRAPRGRVLLLS